MRVRSSRQYDATFRLDAVELLLKSNRTLKEVARDLGIPATTLTYWYKAEMAKRGKKPRPARTPVRDPAEETAEEKIARLERENAALRKAVEQLEMDRAILKKAAAF